MKAMDGMRLGKDKDKNAPTSPFFGLESVPL